MRVRTFSVISFLRAWGSTDLFTDLAASLAEIFFADDFGAEGELFFETVDTFFGLFGFGLLMVADLAEAFGLVFVVGDFTAVLFLAGVLGAFFFTGVFAAGFGVAFLGAALTEEDFLTGALRAVADFVLVVGAGFF